MRTTCEPQTALPFPEGLPEFGEAWALGGSPPTGLEFIGAMATLRCWLLPCPACLDGWTPIVPDGSHYGYRLAVEVGCSVGCEAPLVAWWHAWRTGDLPPHAPGEPGQAARYASACVRRLLQELPEHPTIEQLRSVAYRAGGWLEAGGLTADGTAAALLAAASRAGLPEPSAVLAAAMLAGRAQPRRVPA